VRQSSFLSHAPWKHGEAPHARDLAFAQLRASTRVDIEDICIITCDLLVEVRRETSRGLRR
jgi:hypothetical protein